MKIGSSRQIFNKIFYELSREITPSDKMSEASEKMRTALLVLGGTAEESYHPIDRIKWSSKFRTKWESGESDLEDADELSKEVSVQGMATVNGDIFISDIFEKLWCDEIIRARVLELYPQFDEMDYEAIFKSIWLVLISVQMFEEMLSLETDKDLGIDEWIEACKRHMIFYRDERKK